MVGIFPILPQSVPICNMYITWVCLHALAEITVNVLITPLEIWKLNSNRFLKSMFKIQEGDNYQADSSYPDDIPITSPWNPLYITMKLPTEYQEFQQGGGFPQICLLFLSRKNSILVRYIYTNQRNHLPMSINLAI